MRFTRVTAHLMSRCAPGEYPRTIGASSLTQCGNGPRLAAGAWRIACRADVYPSLLACQAWKRTVGGVSIRRVVVVGVEVDAVVTSAPAGSVARGYLTVVAKWIWFLALAATLAAGAAAASASIDPRVYQATATVRFNVADFGQEFPEDAHLALGQLVSFYAGIVQRPGTISVAATASGTTSADLAGRITVTIDTTRAMFSVAVEDTDPARAASQANALVASTISAAAFSWNLRYQSAEAQLSSAISGVTGRIRVLRTNVATAKRQDPKDPRIAAGLRQIAACLVLRNGLQGASAALTSEYIDLAFPLSVSAGAVPPRVPIAPLPLPSALLGGLLGLLIAAAIMHLVEFVAAPTRTPEALLQLADLAHVAVLRGPNASDPLLVEPANAEAEREYRSLASWLRALSRHSPLRSLLIASALPGEGSTAVAINTAVTLARGETRVLLVDANLRHPTIHRHLGLRANRGLISGVLDLTPDISQSFPLIVSPRVPNLFVLVAGPPSSRLPAEILANQRIRKLLETVVGTDAAPGLADLVVLDASPLVAFPDAASLMGQVDGVLLVVDASQIEPDALTRARQAVEWSGGRLLGVVLTRSTAERNPAPSGSFARAAASDPTSWQVAEVTAWNPDTSRSVTGGSPNGPAAPTELPPAGAAHSALPLGARRGAGGDPFHS